MSTQKSQSVEKSRPDEQVQSVSNRANTKILFVTRTFEYGGAEKHLVELIRRLHQPGIQLSILCLGKDPYTERFSADRQVDIATHNGEPRSLWGWIRLFRSAKPDVVVFIYGWSWCFHWIAPIGLRLSSVRKRFAIQHLLTPAGANQGLLHRILQRLLGHPNLKLSASSFLTTICVSETLRNSLIAEFGFPAKKMRTIRNGVSLSEFNLPTGSVAGLREKLGIGSDEFVLVCPARLSPQKGIDILLQAVARCLADGVRCRCIIVGDGPLGEQLRQQSRELGLSDQVIFTGFKDDIRPYLQTASAFVLTSHREGLPLGILEALASGLPCIVTDVGGNAEAVTHKVHGLVVPPGSADAVAEAITYLAMHPEERAQMSRMARARACQAFDIEKSMAEMRSVILS